MSINQNIEMGLICLCYIVGFGSILFGLLSGNDGYYFVIFGLFVLIMVLIHAVRKISPESVVERIENEDIDKKET